MHQRIGMHDLAGDRLSGDCALGPARAIRPPVSRQTHGHDSGSQAGPASAERQWDRDTHGDSHPEFWKLGTIDQRLRLPTWGVIASAVVAQTSTACGLSNPITLREARAMPRRLCLQITDATLPTSCSSTISESLTATAKSQVGKWSGIAHAPPITKKTDDSSGDGRCRRLSLPESRSQSTPKELTPLSNCPIILGSPALRRGENSIQAGCGVRG